MNLLETLAQEVRRVSAMTLPELEAAYTESENRSISELTALALARKAAEGGMDAIKLMRELSREEPQDSAGVEIRVIPPEPAPRKKSTGRKKAGKGQAENG